MTRIVGKVGKRSDVLPAKRRSFLFTPPPGVIPSAARDLTEHIMYVLKNVVISKESTAYKSQAIGKYQLKLDE
jgi:hypothetical protein